MFDIKICVYISFDVKQQEWAETYEEVLYLAKKFPLCRRVWHENAIKPPYYYLDQAGECILADGTIGLEISGEMDSGETAETFVIPKVLWQDDMEEAEEAVHMDPLIRLVAYEGILATSDERSQMVELLLDVNTKGLKHHIYVLALACLIVHRLNGKASVHGNITIGQVRRAVALVNEHLEHSVDVPPQCDLQHFVQHIKKMPLNAEEEMEFFMAGYMGGEAKYLGTCAEEHFSDLQIQQYWIKRMKYYPTGSVGHQGMVKEFFKHGFGLERFCRIIKTLQPKEVGELYYRESIEIIFKIKLHLKNVNEKKLKWIEPESEETYSAGQWIFHEMLGEEDLERYIPLQDIIDVLTKEFCDSCPVQEIIQDYLEKGKRNLHMEEKDKEYY